MKESEQEARQFYERRLGPKLPDLVWDAVNEDRELADGYAGRDAYGDEEWDEAVQANLESIRHFLKVYDESPTVRDTGSVSSRLRRSERPAELRYTDADRQRLFAMARYFAAEAGLRSDVRSFREAVLDEADLTTEQVSKALEALARLEARALTAPEELDVEAIREEQRKVSKRSPRRAPVLLNDHTARRFVQSPLAQCLALEDFRKNSISPTRHEIKTWSQSTIAGRHPERVVLLVEPEVAICLEEDIGCSIYRVSVRGQADVQAEGDDELVPGTVRVRDAADIHRLAYPLPKGGQGSVEVWPGSVLDELSELAGELARCYHWTEAGAAWFVLTGDMPVVQGLDISVYRNTAAATVDSYVEIRMLPWIDPDTLRAAAIGVRRELAHAGRPIGKRGLRLVDFVITGAVPDIAPADKRWKGLHRDWNDRHGTKDAFRNAADMRAAYYTARDSLLRTRYR